MPLDPATIRATAQRVVDEWAHARPGQFLSPWEEWDEQDKSRFAALVQAGADLARPDLNAGKREAASNGWDAAWRYGTKRIMNASDRAARDRYLAREYPETRECVLSDKSVVTRGSDRMWRRNGGEPITYAVVHHEWRDVLRDTDTGADFDKLKAFAEAVR